MDYSADTGVWVFETRHWSRYAMDDSDEEDEAASEPKRVEGGGTGRSSRPAGGASDQKPVAQPVPVRPGEGKPWPSRAGTGFANVGTPATSIRGESAVWSLYTVSSVRDRW